MERDQNKETDFVEYFKQLNSKDRFKLAFDLEAIAFELFNINDYNEEQKEEQLNEPSFLNEFTEGKNETNN